MVEWKVLLQLAVMGLIAISLIALTRDALAEKAEIRSEVLDGLRLRHVPWGVLQFGIALPTAVFLLRVPYLDVGWWTLLGGSGNIAYGMSGLPGPVFQAAVPTVFVAVLMFGLPVLTHWEERFFRSGAEDWSRREQAWSCVEFGGVHLVAGIPVGGAIAVAAGSAVLVYRYLRRHEEKTLDATFHGDASREATLESTRIHLVYNYIIMGIILLYTLGKLVVAVADAFPLLFL